MERSTDGEKGHGKQTDRSADFGDLRWTCDVDESRISSISERSYAVDKGANVAYQRYVVTGKQSRQPLKLYATSTQFA